MFNFGPTFIWTMLNLCIMYLILKRFLFKPVMKIMEDRENSIKNKIDNAERIQSDARADKMKYQEQLKNAQKDGEVIIKDAKGKAQRESEELLKDTERKAEDMIREAKQEIEEERLQMLKEIRKQVVDLAILAASKIMEINLNNDTNKKVVQNFLDEEGVL